MDFVRIAAAARCKHPKNVEANWPAIEICLKALGVWSVMAVIAAIATIAVETDYTFQPVREEGGEAYLKAKKYWPYYGRGYIQLTWRDEYEAYGKALGIDLVDDPDRAMNPLVAASVFAKYFRDHHIQVAADAGNWKRVRELVNGGDNGLEQFLAIVEKLKEVMNG